MREEKQRRRDPRRTSAQRFLRADGCKAKTPRETVAMGRAGGQLKEAVQVSVASTTGGGPAASLRRGGRAIKARPRSNSRVVGDRNRSHTQFVTSL